MTLRTIPWSLEEALRSPQEWETFRVVQDEDYRESRRAWAEAIGRPYPMKPEPGAIDAEDPEAG